MSPFFDLEFSLWRRLKPWLLLVIVLILAGFGWAAFSHVDGKEESALLQQQIALLTDQVSLQETMLKSHRDTIGRLTYTVKVVEIDKEVAQAEARRANSFINTQLRQVNTSLKELREAQKTVKQVMNWKIESNAEILTILRDTILESHLLKHVRDSVRYDSVKIFAKTFDFEEKDGWFRVTGLVTHDSISISLRNFKEELVKVDQLVRPDRPRLVPYFLRRRILVTKIKNLNPYSSLKDFTQLNVKPQ